MLTDDEFSGMYTTATVVRPSDFSLDTLLSAKSKRAIIEGYFVTDKASADSSKITIMPKPGTAGEKLLQDTAASFGKTVSEVSPKRIDYSLQFFVEDVIAGNCETGIITLYMNENGYKMYPSVKSGDKAILILQDIDGKYYNYTHSFYYIVSSMEYNSIMGQNSAESIVLSAESYPSLDKYSGMTISAFKSELAELYNVYQVNKTGS